MTTDEAVTYYYDKKISGTLSKSQIRQELSEEKGFSVEEVNSIIKAIYDKELDDIQHKSSGINAFTHSIYFSYFFILFSVVAIVVSVLLMKLNTKTELSRYLPWVIILGATFILAKHISIIYKRRKQD